MILKNTTLDDPNISPQSTHICKKKLNWVKLDPDIPRFEEMQKREYVYQRKNLKSRKLVEQLKKAIISYYLFLIYIYYFF